MIAIDGPHNGWRSIILVFAETDALVRDSVLAVSTAHLALRAAQDRVRLDALSTNQETSQKTPPEAPASSLSHHHDFYVKVLEGLKRRHELGCIERRDRLSVLSSILLLLTAAMIKGDPNFATILRMLQSAVEFFGDNGPSDNWSSAGRSEYHTSFH
jgi:hypothetical protein